MGKSSLPNLQRYADPPIDHVDFLFLLRWEVDVVETMVPAAMV